MDSAVGPHVYRADLDGSQQVRLTEGRGTHSVSLNGDGSLLVDSFSSLENAGESWLRKADGSAVRQLKKSEVPKDANITQLAQIPARDGETLDVSVTRPLEFDAQQKYPVWIDTYSGPDAPTIRDRWNSGRSDWYAQNGIVVLRCNVRSASGRGQKYSTCCYKQFGVQELLDLEDAVKWITTTHEWADAERVGIGGWSYGGFMAGFALTHSKMFKCGVAGAGVFDWELYDTIYTERYMAMPQNNRDGYAKSSVTKAAKDLHGHLLIVHGTMDDNVHMQNAVQFIHELQTANKQNFTFMVYPKSRHGVRSPHLGEMRQRFIKEHL
jgi:dipeptidyl-peptidase-4